MEKVLAPEKQAAHDLKHKSYPEDVKLVGVVFKKTWKRYYVGDKAGFPAEIAAKLVAGGAAYYKVKPEEEKAEKPEAPKAAAAQDASDPKADKADKGKKGK